MRRIFFVIDPRRQRRSISLWINPVFILDLRTRTAGIANLLRGAFGCLILSFGLVLVVSGTWGATEPDTIRVIALSFQIGLIALIGPSLTIGAIASEVEARTFDSLRMTPLRAWTIFIGKFGAAAMLSIMLVLASVPVFFALRYIEQVNETNALRAMFGQPQSLIAMFAVTCSTLVFALADGLFFSSICRTTARAGAWAYGLMAAVTTASLLGWVLRERLSEGTASFVLAFNPIVTAIGSVSDTRFVEYGHWQHNAWALGTLSALLIAGTAYRLRRSAGPEE
jgi:ABC-type transport system involved in multi-copper enzyme maturation permease subunit